MDRGATLRKPRFRVCCPMQMSDTKQGHAETGFAGLRVARGGVGGLARGVDALSQAVALVDVGLESTRCTVSATVSIGMPGGARIASRSCRRDVCRSRIGGWRHRSSI
jgi:hypothetical protein